VQVGSSILETSRGNLCDGGRHTSQFDCPATCVYDSSKPLMPLCGGFYLNEIKGSDSCGIRPPCPPGGFNADINDSSSDEDDYLSDEELEGNVCRLLNTQFCITTFPSIDFDHELAEPPIDFKT
jgi:hypothetical protein